MDVLESLRKDWNSELTRMYSKSRDLPYSSARRFQIAGALSLTVMTLIRSEGSSDLRSASRASAWRVSHEMTDAEMTDADSSSESSGVGLGSFPRTRLRHL